MSSALQAVLPNKSRNKATDLQLVKNRILTHSLESPLLIISIL
jgi:hypothetical protein